MINCMHIRPGIKENVNLGVMSSLICQLIFNLKKVRGVPKSQIFILWEP